ncbi:MAG: hypothetical protein WC285_03935 [Candidatus Gracilibacteria bacterium]
MIAYGAGALDESEDSFINKAKEHKTSIEGTKIELLWGDGNTTTDEIDKRKIGTKLVRYLPQKAVEQLCSPKHHSQLLQQIENVIFQSLDITDKGGTSNFNELQNKLFQNLYNEKADITGQIKAINKIICEEKKKIKSTDIKEKRIKEAEQELDKLKTTLPKLPTKEQKEQEELAKLSKNKEELENKIIELKDQTEKIEQIKSKVKVFKTRIEEFKSDLIKSLGMLRIKEEEANVFIPKFDEIKGNEILDARGKKIEEQIELIKTGDKDKLKDIFGDEKERDNLSKINEEITKKNAIAKAYETVKLKYQEQSKKINTTEKEIEAIKEEIKNIKDVTTPYVTQLQTERLNKYCGYFEILKREKNELEKLYKPLQDSLDEKNTTGKLLKFKAKIDYKIHEHAGQISDILDKRRHELKDAKSIEIKLHQMWKEYILNDFDETKIKEATTKFIKELSKLGTLEEFLREGYDCTDIANIIFDTENFSVISSLTFDGIALNLLSPGQKGIVLLILYLAIDKQDTRPLIIDQPEDNLDSLSVYNDLIDFFRERKQFRQIIIITHNPNLVVNTDAEQVIVAHYNGNNPTRITYESGSLENIGEKIAGTAVEDYEEGMIDQVCNILEGGNKAFDRRKKKYELSKRKDK